MHLVLDAQELQTDWLAEESENGVKPHLLEKFGLFDSLEQRDLLLGGKAGDGCGSRKQLGAFGLRFNQAALVKFLLVLIDSRPASGQ